MHRTVIFAVIAGILGTPALARNPNVDPDVPLSGMVAVTPGGPERRECGG